MIKIDNYDELMSSIGTGKYMLKISTPWCGPCKMVRQNIESIENDYGDVTFVDIDADDCDDKIIEDFGVRGVPVVILYNHGEEIDRTIGLQTIEQLKNRLNNLN